MKINKNEGIDYKDEDSVGRAKSVDLITLPKKIEGTNCANCKFVKILDESRGRGFCTNKDILLPVTAHMCCALWDAEGSGRSWKDKKKDG